MMWNTGTGWAAWLVMTLAMVGVWALVIFGIIAVFRRITESRATERSGKTAMRTASSMRSSLGAGLTPRSTAPATMSCTQPTHPRAY